MSQPGSRPLELGEFLRSRRNSLPPREGRRRVPGLRREEVATAANVSVDYYTRLEQGRAAHPSREVIDALAGALQLSDHERQFVLSLASDVTASAAPAASIPPNLIDLIEVVHSPAFVMDASLDIVAWNGLASRILLDFDAERLDGRVNLALLTFTNSAFRSAYVDWPRKAQGVVAMLRFRLPSTPALLPVVDELLERSAEFRQLWEDWLVADKQRGDMALRHPLGGALDTSFQLMPASGTEFEVCVYTTPSASESRSYIDALAREAIPAR